jgi:hypothetical protein
MSWNVAITEIWEIVSEEIMKERESLQRDWKRRKYRTMLW